jgi:hypothetical protein
MSSNSRIDQTFFLSELPIGDGQIDFLYSAILKLLDQLLISLIILRDNHHPGCILIQAVNDAWPQDTVNSTKVVTMVEEGIDQRARRISRSRMNNHPSWLINDDHGRIFIEDSEGNRFRVQGKGFGPGESY